jgi:hypothetical protein
VKSEARVARKALNYVGQLRLYSYADLVLLLVAVGATAQDVAQCSLLWFGFLIHLEWSHRDRGRLPWPWQAWAIPCIAGFAVQPSPRLVAFVIVAVIYSNKKRISFIALVGPLVNGAIKGALAFLVVQASWEAILAVTLLTAARNLAGDFRDIMKDRHEGVETIPVRLGIKHDIRWLYPTALIATSATWVWAGGLPAWSLVLAAAVQVATYRLTPR